MAEEGVKRKLISIFSADAKGLSRLMGKDEIPELAFFPGMDLDSSKKIELFDNIIEKISRTFNLVSMIEHAASVLDKTFVRSRNIDRKNNLPSTASSYLST